VVIQYELNPVELGCILFTVHRMFRHGKTLTIDDKCYMNYHGDVCFNKTYNLFLLFELNTKNRLSVNEISVDLHPCGFVDLNVTSNGKFHTKLCLSSLLFFVICVMPSSRPYKTKCIRNSHACKLVKVTVFHKEKEKWQIKFSEFLNGVFDNSISSNFHDLYMYKV